MTRPLSKDDQLDADFGNVTPLEANSCGGDVFPATGRRV